MSQKRKDNKGRILKNGESQRKNGTYAYRYKDSRNREQWIYAKSLNDLREKEKEVERLLLTDTDYAGGNITVLCLVEKYIQLRTGVRENTIKNGERYIPMSNKAFEVFTRVVNNRKRPAVETIVDGYVGFLFLDIYENPKVAMHLEHAMKRILTSYNKSHAVQLPPITPHTFRHTFISRMYANGMKAKNLQELVGHADIQTTLGIYTHTTYEQIEQEFLKIVSI